ncbi:signal peptidase I [Candidatus Dependentiae bacterium]|nr:signal peptidase I [Candidatus Dependentiae bacterium]
MQSRAGKPGFLATFKEVVVLLLVVFVIRTIGFGLYQVPTGSMETTMLVGERFFADKLSYWFTKPKAGEIIAFNDPIFPYSKNRLNRLFQEYVWGPSNWTKRVIGVPGDHIKGVIENGKPVIYRNGQRLEEPYINKYPLIRVFKIDITELKNLLRRGASAENMAGLVVLKSFDPAKPYDQQPFYTIDPRRVISLGNDDADILQPGTPLRLEKELGSLPDESNYWTRSDIFNVHLGPNEYWVMGDNRLGSQDSRFFGPLDGRLIHGKILFRLWSQDSDESWWIVDLVKHPIDFWKRVRWSRFLQRIR